GASREAAHSAPSVRSFASRPTRGMKSFLSRRIGPGVWTRHREQVIRQLLVHRYRFRKNLVNLLTIALAVDLLGPLDSIRHPVAGKARDFLLALLGFRIAPHPGLLNRKLSSLVEKYPHHAVLRIGDIHHGDWLILDNVGTLRFEDQARLVQPLAKYVQNVIQRCVAIALDTVFLQFL